MPLEEIMYVPSPTMNWIYRNPNPSNVPALGQRIRESFMKRVLSPVRFALEVKIDKRELPGTAKSILLSSSLVILKLKSRSFGATRDYVESEERLVRQNEP